MFFNSLLKYLDTVGDQLTDNDTNLESMHLFILVLSLNAGLFLSPFQQADTSSTITASPTIDEVTVYLQGAQITHHSDIDIPEGRHTIVFTGLNANINSQNTTVGFGRDSSVNILAVNHNTRRIENRDSSEVINRLLSEKNRINHLIRDVQVELDVINYEQAMLSQNRQPKDSDAEALRELLSLHRERVRALRTESGVSSDSLKGLQNRLGDINQTLSQPGYQTHFTEGELTILVENGQAQSVEATISYPIDDAGWMPEYDLHVDAAGEPLRGRLNASVYNNSMQPWNDVRMILSTQAPGRGIDLPAISPWFLDYIRPGFSERGSNPDLSSAMQLTGTITDAETGDPLPGANVRVQDMQAGTTAGRDGRYSFFAPAGSARLIVNYIGYRAETVPIRGTVMDIRLQPDMVALDEVVVSGYSGEEDFFKLSAPPSTREEQMVSREFAIRDHQTVLSDGKTHRITVEESTTSADFAYLAIPKIRKGAVLKADIEEWSSLFPLPGTAMLHLEGTYVGQTYINPSTVADTLQMSFGQDDAIVVSRTKQSDQSDRSFFRNRVTRTISHEISVRNTKPGPIEIEITDQIPVSMRDDIEVTATELSDGEVAEDTGIVNWTLQIPAGETRSLMIAYEVRHPSGHRVYLE